MLITLETVDNDAMIELFVYTLLIEDVVITGPIVLPDSVNRLFVVTTGVDNDEAPVLDDTETNWLERVAFVEDT